MDDGDAEYVRRHASQKRGAVQAKLLKYAIQHDQVSMVHLLLDIGVSADKGCREDEEERLVPLHYALWPDHDKGLRKASQRLQVLRTSESDTDLNTSIELIKSTKKECDRVRGLYPNHGRSVAELVRAGADIDKRNSDEETPLMLASKFGSVEAIRILIENGSNIESLDRDGDTALAIAVALGHAEVTLALLNGGANIHAESANGMTPLMIAALFENIDIISTLVCNGADIESEGKIRRSPLILVSEHGNAKSVSALIKNGANTEATVNGEYTAIMLASLLGHTEVIVALINGGASIEKRSNDGATSLMLAAALGHVEVLKVLLRHGANIHAIDNDGHNALQYANIKGKQEAATLLEEYGSSNTHACSEQGHPVASYCPPAQVVIHAPPSAHKHNESSNQIPTDAGLAFIGGMCCTAISCMISVLINVL